MGSYESWHDPVDIESENRPDGPVAFHQQEVPRGGNKDVVGYDLNKGGPFRVVGKRYVLGWVEEYQVEYGKDVFGSRREWLRVNRLDSMDFTTWVTLYALINHHDNVAFSDIKNPEPDRASPSHSTSAASAASSTLPASSVPSPTPQLPEEDKESEYFPSCSEESESSYSSCSDDESELSEGQSIKRPSKNYKQSRHSVVPKRKVLGQEKVPLREFKKRVGPKDAIYLLPIRSHYFVGLYIAKKKTIYVSDSRNLTTKSSKSWQKCKETLKNNRPSLKIKGVPLIEDQCKELNSKSKAEKDRNVLEMEHAVLLARVYNRIYQRGSNNFNELRLTYDNKLAGLIEENKNKKRRGQKEKKQPVKPGVELLREWLLDNNSPDSISDVKERKNQAKSKKPVLTFHLINEIYKMR